jgi:hypothetical protein
MPRGSRLAAAGLALALAAAGCDLVSSLTPFGIGERGPDVSQDLYSGSWSGSTSAAGTVAFNVVGGEVVDLVVTHALDCGVLLELPFTEAILIEDGAFSAEIQLDPQGNAVLSGRFTSRDSATAAYSFRSLPTAANCQNAGAGSFTATKVP